MKKLLTLLIILSTTQLTGCLSEKINTLDIKKAIKYCGGVNEIWELAAYAEKVRITCKDRQKPIGFTFSIVLGGDNG